MSKEYVSITIPKSTKKLLEELAHRKGITLEQMIREFLASGMILDHFIKQGVEVELIIPSKERENE